MFRQIRQELDKENDYLDIKYLIIDNIDKLSKKDLSILFIYYWKKYWKFEKLQLVRHIYWLKWFCQ